MLFLKTCCCLSVHSWAGTAKAVKTQPETVLPSTRTLRQLSPGLVAHTMMPPEASKIVSRGIVSREKISET
jgi:hypothetical protein